MKPEWITLTIFEDLCTTSIGSGCEIDVKPSHILCMTELKRDEVRMASSDLTGKRPETLITLDDPIDTLEDANECIVVRGLRKIWVYETLSEIRVLLNRQAH